MACHQRWPFWWVRLYIKCKILRNRKQVDAADGADELVSASIVARAHVGQHILERHLFSGADGYICISSHCESHCILS